MRRGLFALLVVAIACGGPSKRARKTVANTQPPELDAQITANDFRATAPRPALDLSQLEPDFHEELRWPLSHTAHPALEPRYAIAQELAVGLDWEELCSRGVQNRVSATQRELLAYLRGWCHTLKRDVDNACAQLAPLIGSTHRGLTPAVRQDLANILVTEGADKAEHWLNKHNIRDITLLDLLAANFIDLGSRADAAVMVRRVIDSDDFATAATKCRRLVKHALLTQGQESATAADQLQELATVPKVPDRTCLELHNKLTCSRAFPSNCDEYFADRKVDPKLIKLADVYATWPTGPHFRQRWWKVADAAEEALPHTNATEFVVAAWEAALQANDDCEASFAYELHESVGLMRMDPSTKPYEARFKQLESACAKPELPVAVGMAAAQPTPVSKPPSAPCDAQGLKEQGMQNINLGQPAAALVKFEASLACAHDDHTVHLAYMAACKAGNKTKTKHYYDQLKPSVQARISTLECAKP